MLGNNWERKLVAYAATDSMSETFEERLKNRISTVARESTFAGGETVASLPTEHQTNYSGLRTNKESRHMSAMPNFRDQVLINLRRLGGL